MSVKLLEQAIIKLDKKLREEGLNYREFIQLADLKRERDKDKYVNKR